MFAVFISSYSHLCNHPIYISSTELRSPWRLRFAKVKFILYCSARNEAHIFLPYFHHVYFLQKYLPFPVFSLKIFSILNNMFLYFSHNSSYYFPPYFSHLSKILVEVMFIYFKKSIKWRRCQYFVSLSNSEKTKITKWTRFKIYQNWMEYFLWAA